MKKIILTLIMTLTIMMMPIVKAANITTMSASESTSGEITISGTVEDSVIAVATLIYDSKGENLITMQTVQVNDDNTYNATFTLDAETYVVKVADYSGGNYKTATISPNTTTSGVSSSEDYNPKTGDNILLYVVLGLISLVGLSSIAIYFKKTTKASR